LRTIFAKVVLWALGTFALSLVAYWAIWLVLMSRGPRPGDPIARLIDMVQDDLSQAYEDGGPGRLADRLHRLADYLPGEHFLTDTGGRDLVSGEDRSGLLSEGSGHPGPPRLVGRRFLFVGRPRDGRYRFISVVNPWFGPPNILPYYGAVVLVIVLMGAILAAHLAMPLRHLRRVVDRFGRGDLAARADSPRKDEIGELARAFDEMAGRIEVLLTAERRLLQDVSHELRSPLTRLDVAADLASTSEDPGEYLVRIRRDVSRLSTLVEELLQLTRAEGDPAAREREEVRLDDLLHGLAADCALEAEAGGRRLDLDAPSPATVLGEPELLRRAVENVVRNAIRYAPEGTAVEIGLERDGDTATVIVRDHGPGVPEEALGTIFEPFFRVEGHRSRTSGGAGLGLAIARRAVDLHRGRISARNAKPGLSVTIELPMADPHDGDAAA
jgi:two-component system sensor histidine kinase CpxA